jgi:acetoin utilization protein AcuB
MASTSTSSPLVRTFMTPAPHTIGSRQSLVAARSLMQQHRIRHLPVLDDGKLVGILNERDLSVIERLPGIDAATIIVEDAMAIPACAVAEDAPLAAAAAAMAETKLGSAVVMNGGRVVGLFTSADAMRALSALLGAPGAESPR